MDVTTEQFDELIGAYALDACTDDEVAALDRYVRSHPEASAEVERLREAAAALGAVGAMQPPVALRDRVLQAANERVRAVTAQEALQAETDRFNAFLDTITAADLGVVTHNGLSVHDLVAHVEAIDRAFVAEADEARYGFIGGPEVEEITAEVLPQHAGESFAETVTRFRRTRADLVALGDRLPRDRRLAGYKRDDTLVIRAFETWTHHDDISRALNRDRTLPAPAVMRAMAELSMQSLPLAMAVKGTPHPERTARLILTGPGGGEWTIACGPGEPRPGAAPDVVIRTSVVEWCRRFADRLAPDEVPMEVDGDAELARELATAANAFAGL
jgi:uncharacterized protein (TIGR03083 family)